MARNIIFESLTTDIIKSESIWQGYLSINDNKNINNDLVNAIINNDDILVSVVYEDNSEDDLLITNKEVDTESALKSFNYEFNEGYIRTDNITNVAFSMSSELTPTKFVFYIEAQDKSVMLKSGSLRSGNDSADISKIKLSNTTYNIKDATARADILNKQDTLVSGTNIKTVNNQSLLGSGNLTIESGVSDVTVEGTSIVNSQGIAELNSNIKVFSLTSGESGGTRSTYAEIREAYDYWAQNPYNTLIIIDKMLVTHAIDFSNLMQEVIYFNVGAFRGYFNVSPYVYTYVCDYTDPQTAYLRSITNGLQQLLVSGTNIKTINSTSLLGSGDISINGTVYINSNDITPATYDKLADAYTNNKVIILKDRYNNVFVCEKVTKSGDSYIIHTGLVYKNNQQYYSATYENDGSHWLITESITGAVDSTYAMTTYAPKVSPNLSGTPTAPTAATGTNTTQIATTAFVQNTVGNLTDVLTFKGTIGSATQGSGTRTDIPTTDVNVGDTWLIVDEARTLAAAYSATGQAVLLDVGDTILAVSDDPLWATSPAKDDIGVTSVNAGTGLTTGADGTTGGAITTSGTLKETYTTLTLPTFSQAGYQSVSVTGVTSNSHPILDIIIPSGTSVANTKAMIEAWSHIYNAETSAGAITFYSNAATTTQLIIAVKGY